MVKFSKQFEGQLVPEWKDAFVDYGQLKKDLKKIHLLNVENAPSNNHESSLSKTILSSIRNSSLFRNKRREHGIIHVHKKLESSESKGDMYQTELLEQFADDSDAAVEFFSCLDLQLNKVNQFFKNKEKEFLERGESLEKQMGILLELKSALKSQHANEVSSNGSKEDDSISGTISCDEESPRYITEQEQGKGDLTGKGDETDDRFDQNDFQFSRSSKFDEDYKSMKLKRADSNPRTPSGRFFSQGKTLKIHIPLTNPTRTFSYLLWDDLIKQSSKKGGMEGRKVHVNKTKIHHAEKMIRGAFIELYKGLGYLKTYRNLNMLAFAKILKKFDKVTNKQVLPIYLKVVESSYFNSSDKVIKLADEVEEIFVKHFAQDDKRKAMKYLKPTQTTESHVVTFFIGLFTGCFIAFLIGYGIMAHIAGMYRPQSDTVYMETVYPVLSMFSLLFLHFFLYGCNIFAWRKTRINYSFIFELSLTKDLKYRDVFLICTMSMTAVVGVLFIHISLMAKGYSYTQIQVIPGLLLMISLLLLVCPLNIVYRSSRYHLLRVLRNIVLSPLYKVVMLDFFMADQLCSQVPMLRNLEYVTCYYITGSYKTQDYGYCMRTKNYRDLAYAVSFLLYYWRAMQCARRWFDEGETSHLINLGKYVSAMLAAGAKVAYEKERTIGWLCLFRSQWTPRSRKSYTREEFDDVRLEALGYIQRFVEGYVRRREYDLADDMFWEAGNVCANEELQALLLDKHRQLDVYSKALKFFKAQKFARALDKIEVLGAAVNFPVLWVLKLRCLLKLNRAKDADEIKSKIVDISAKNVTVLFDLGKSYMEEGDYVSALEVYAKGVDSAQDQKIKFSFTEECEKAQHMKNKDGGPV